MRRTLGNGTPAPTGRKDKSVAREEGRADRRAPGERRSASLSPRFLETSWKKRVLQFAAASRTFTVSFTTLRGEHIISSDTTNTIQRITFAEVAATRQHLPNCFACG